MDYLVFSLIVLAGFTALRVWLRRSDRSLEIPLWTWLAVLCLIAAGWFYVRAAGQTAARQIRHMLEGFPPTYAQEIERMGHAGITTATSADDPAYLAIVAAQIRWERVNPAIADIYTLRKLPDGRNVFVVDSETDYDRNGRFEGEREQRTPIGEIYPEADPGLERAFLGEAVFDDTPVTDRWGTWISAFVPLHDGEGRVEAVLGVDFPAAAWIQAIAQARLTAMSELCVLAIFLGSASAVITLLRADLRNRKLAVERGRQMNIELERRVLERTAELVHANDALRMEIAARKLAALQLAEAHTELLAVSRQAGMAEFAIGILHNVGNVLNSVNVASTCMADSLHRSKAANLSKVVALLREHKTDLGTFLTSDPKGRLVPEFLALLAEHLAGEQATALHELAQLQKNIEHIRDIVTMQQGMAKTSGGMESVNVTELVEGALRLNQGEGAWPDLEVIKEGKDLPPIRAEKHRVLQILVNLIRNAKQACAASGHQENKLRIQMTAENGRVRIAVSDTGVGISPENLTRVFAHGFTTKKDGHGFGLHSAALTAKEMGGSLTVQSDGPGHGATFVLELPHQPDTPAHENSAP